METLAISCTDVTHAYTHTHTHYFLGRNERLVLSFVLCTASRLVSCNVTREGEIKKKKIGEGKKGRKMVFPFHHYPYIYIYVHKYTHTPTHEFFLPFDSSIFVYIRVSLKRVPWCRKTFPPSTRFERVSRLSLIVCCIIYR